MAEMTPTPQPGNHTSPPPIRSDRGCHFPGRLAAALAVLLLGSFACDTRNPCEKLADRDCDRWGPSSDACRESRERAARADPFLIEVCRREMEKGKGAWGER
jgi:hypothetical protein